MATQPFFASIPTAILLGKLLHICSQRFLFVRATVPNTTLSILLFIKNNIHVISDKPFAGSLAQAKKLYKKESASII